MLSFLSFCITDYNYITIIHLRKKKKRKIKEFKEYKNNRWYIWKMK